MRWNTWCDESHWTKAATADTKGTTLQVVNSVIYSYPSTSFCSLHIKENNCGRGAEKEEDNDGNEGKQGKKGKQGHKGHKGHKGHNTTTTTTTTTTTKKEWWTVGPQLLVALPMKFWSRTVESWPPWEVGSSFLFHLVSRLMVHVFLFFSSSSLF